MKAPPFENTNQFVFLLKAKSQGNLEQLSDVLAFFNAYSLCWLDFIGRYRGDTIIMVPSILGHVYLLQTVVLCTE